MICTLLVCRIPQELCSFVNTTVILSYRFYFPSLLKLVRMKRCFNTKFVYKQPLSRYIISLVYQQWLDILYQNNVKARSSPFFPPEVQSSLQYVGSRLCPLRVCYSTAEICRDRHVSIAVQFAVISMWVRRSGSGQFYDACQVFPSKYVEIFVYSGRRLVWDSTRLRNTSPTRWSCLCIFVSRSYKTREGQRDGQTDIHFITS
jgi:hypothetical protein